MVSVALTVFALTVVTLVTFPLKSPTNVVALTIGVVMDAVALTVGAFTLPFKSPTNMFALTV